MPRLRLSRLLPALLLIAAVFVALRLRGSTSNHLEKIQAVQQPLRSDDSQLRLSDAYTRRIVAVGDIHSDYGNALRVLQMADVVDSSGNWTGNVDLFVQTGDIIDRGVDTLKLYLWMEQLRSQARAAGGDVVSHLGNHEWMNLLADWRYVYPKEIATFGSVAARQKMLQTGRIGRAWAANYSITSRVPLHPPMGPQTPFPASASAPLYNPPSGLSSIDFSPLEKREDEDPLASAALSFVHGGLSPAYSHLTPYPSAINELGYTLLARLQRRQFPPPHPPAPYAGLPADATNEERSLYGDDGPLWYRGWALKKEEEICGEVDEVLKRTGVRRLIMGHTPDFEHIVSRCDGKIIIIDTGISHAYGGALSALSVQYTLAPHVKDARRWTEREVVTALYMDRQEVLVVEERELTSAAVP